MYPLLTGLRVVEGAAFIAGPSCGLYLAQMGAEVIRFDNIGGGPDFNRWPLADNGASLYWEGLNKGKKSVVLDLSRSTLSCWLDALTWDVRLRIDFRVREVLVGKLNSLPVTFHHQHGAGAVSSKMNQAIAGFVAAFGDLAFKSLPAVLYLRAVRVLADE